MAHTRISRRQWRALNRILATQRDAPKFPAQPYPWGFHQGTWTSLWRRDLVKFTFRSNVCHVRLTARGHEAVNQVKPSR